MYHKLLSKDVAETIACNTKKKKNLSAPIKYEIHSIWTILNSLNLSLLGKRVLLHSLSLSLRASATSHCQKHDLDIPTCQSCSNHRWLWTGCLGNGVSLWCSHGTLAQNTRFAVEESTHHCAIVQFFHNAVFYLVPSKVLHTHTYDLQINLELKLQNSWKFNSQPKSPHHQYLSPLHCHSGYSSISHVTAHLSASHHLPFSFDLLAPFRLFTFL